MAINFSTLISTWRFKYVYESSTRFKSYLSSASSITFRSVTHCSSVHGGGPLRVHCRRVGLEVTELLLLLGVLPPLTTSLFWRLVNSAVLVGHT